TVSAFNSNSLQQLVRLHLNKNLEAIAGNGTFSDVVFSLLTWAEREGFTVDLLRAMKEERPRNKQVQAITEELLTPQAAATPLRIRIAVKAERTHVELIIDRDFASYTEEEQTQLLEAIKAMLNIYGEVRVIKKERGSVKLTLEITASQAEKLIQEVRAGK